jgi:hypothetical protein
MTSTVPVVLPFVEVWVAPGGRLTITVDREPYDIPANVVPAGRPALAHILDEITTRLASPVRVEVHETDSTTFTDIVTPRPAPTTVVPEPAEAHPAPLPTRGAFVPGEAVAVAVVITHAAADETGSAQVRLPAALMAKHRGAVLLVGRTSRTVAFTEDGGVAADTSNSQGVA